MPFPIAARNAFLWASAAPIALSATIAACSSAGTPHGFSDPSSPAAVDSGGAGTASLGGGDAGGVSANDAEACASTSVAAALVPVNLLFVVDESDSMTGTSTPTKWKPVTDALKQFFGDPKSAGLSASLQYFPIDSIHKLTNYCVVDAYKTPMVPLRPLPDGVTFATSLDGRLAADHLGTPTRPALEGALAYGATLPGKSAVILATDGLPTADSCPKDTVADVASVAAAAAATIPTFVIGVGSSLSNLDVIAKGGGTGAAMMVSVGSAAQTTADLLAAINTIRASVVPCEIDLPAPPPGQTFALDRVNVTLASGASQIDTLAYSSDCSDASGWHYDQPTAPTKIALCAKACATAKSSASQLSVAFGCATLGGVR